MAEKIRWRRAEYEGRLDSRAGSLHEFVDAVLGSIDYEAARASPAAWAIVRSFFNGCAKAAGSQGTKSAGAEQIRRYFEIAFLDPEGSDEGAEGVESQEAWHYEGFSEFMDWVSNPASFRPVRLQAALAQ